MVIKLDESHGIRITILNFPQSIDTVMAFTRLKGHRPNKGSSATFKWISNS